MRRGLVLALVAAALAGGCGGDERDREAEGVRLGLAANVDGPGVGEELDRVAATGARWVREDLEWSLVQPRPGGPLRFGAFDAVVREAARRGLRVLPILDGTPCWAAPDDTPRDACSSALPPRDEAFAAFAAAAAARYGPGGAFWDEHPDLDAGLAPTHLEVLNEPYHGQDPARAARLHVAAVRAGREANPRVRWLLPATTSAGGVDWPAALQRAAPDLLDHVDALAVHAYPQARPPEERLVGFVQQVRAALGGRPAWITETGYAACGPEAPAPERCVPGATRAERERRKADWLARAIALLRDAPGVEAVFVFTLRSWDVPFEGDHGLLDERGRPLPAHDAVRRALD